MSDRSQVAALMVTPQMQTVVIERRGRSSILGITADRRREHKREELRGLLVLRYHMETTSLNNNGYIVTRQMLILAEAHLVRRGFKPGADGLSVDEFFNVT
jgi:hypothetical protein